MTFDHTAITNERIKWVSGNLYECLSSDTDCRHRFQFGFSYFCSSLMKGKFSSHDNRPPCLSDSEQILDGNNPEVL